MSIESSFMVTIGLWALGYLVILIKCHLLQRLLNYFGLCEMFGRSLSFRMSRVYLFLFTILGVVLLLTTPAIVNIHLSLVSSTVFWRKSSSERRKSHFKISFSIQLPKIVKFYLWNGVSASDSHSHSNVILFSVPSGRPRGSKNGGK